MLQPDSLAGCLQSFLLGRELLRERRSSPDAAEALEVRFGVRNQERMGVNKNIWKHDIYVLCAIRLPGWFFFLLTLDFPLPETVYEQEERWLFYSKAKALNMVTIGFLYWGTNKQTCSSHSSSQSLTVARSQVFFEWNLCISAKFDNQDLRQGT